MSYVLTSRGNRPGYIVNRDYHGFTARDYIAPLSRVFGGRLPCSGALTFDTVEAARKYLNHHSGLILDTWKICEYNPCMNSIVGEVE